MKRNGTAARHRVSGSSADSRVGLVQWFRPGDYDRVETALADARALGVKDLRTGLCWADWYSSEGDGWYAWLLPRLAQEVNILPCLIYTPPSLGIVPKYSSPPSVPKTYADFIDVAITRYGHLFEWIELWDSPDQPHQWDARLDPEWRIFTEMVGGAAYWAHTRGRKTVLPGLSQSNPEWLSLMHARGVLDHIDAIGIHGYPGNTETGWRGWQEEIGSVRKRLAELNHTPEIWITETGFSTWRGDECAQVQAFVEAKSAPADRVYWNGLYDNRPDRGNVDSFHSDERMYHYGLKRADGRPKVLFEMGETNGLSAIRQTSDSAGRHSSGERKFHTLITGGAGFIGTNLANRLLAAGQPVLIYDNLSRPGADRNLAWLQETYGSQVQAEIADVRDTHAIRNAVRWADRVFHFAAQVAVTTSLTDPQHDFSVNIAGTLNLLEALRELNQPPSLLFTSTNKVYGGLNDLALQPAGTRYQPLDSALRTGVNERRPLDFHSPYGCSKGAADQYVLDYARTFGLPAVVFRMSCIYGLHQNGTEDQGWVAHFLIRTLQHETLTLYGDGMQVRDLLFVEDLVDAFLLAQSNIRTLSGQAFNIGGGLGNTMSLLELINLIEMLHGERPATQLRHWRPGDQRYYVSDTRKFKEATGWAPKINVNQGIRRLYEWLVETSGAPAVPPELRPMGALDAIFAH